MIRRFLTRVLIIILIAACTYNWMQTQRLQAQVAALETQAAQPKQVTLTKRVPEAQGGLYSLHSYYFLHSYYSLHRLYSLQGPWKRLQHQAGVVRSTSKKVLSYVKL